MSFDGVLCSGCLTVGAFCLPLTCCTT